MIDMKRTGQNIKAACAREGITVKQIQEELNIGAFQSIYNWFSGKALPSLENFYGLCQILNVSMESLIAQQQEEIWVAVFDEQCKAALKYLSSYQRGVRQMAS